MDENSEFEADSPFVHLYRKIDPRLARSLLSFRKRYPPRTFSHAGYDWPYIVAGQGDETALLLHGMAGAYDLWWQQIEALRAQYRLISVTYPPIDTLAGLTAGLLALLDHLGVDRVHLVGTSLGGYLAQYIVARHADIVLDAVFGNTFPPNRILVRRTRGAEPLLRILPEGIILGAMRLNIRRSLYPAGGRSELLKAYLLEGTFRNMSKPLFLARYRTVMEWFDLPQEPPRIPLMILEAENDPLITPALRATLRETYPEAAVINLGSVGHFSYINRPLPYTQTLEAFWQGTHPLGAPRKQGP